MSKKVVRIIVMVTVEVDTDSPFVKEYQDAPSDEYCAAAFILNKIRGDYQTFGETKAEFNGWGQDMTGR